MSANGISHHVLKRDRQMTNWP